MSEKTKYLHSKHMHNMLAPRIIADKFCEHYTPKTVIDFGCGLGTFLKAFKEKGATEILGLDGPWTNVDLLSEIISRDEFQEVDLEKPIDLNQKYDLAISLEVGEHLHEDKADVFVENLTNASDIILFSAAVPHQGGQNHINEQWVEYWQEKFSKHDYVFYDVFRQELWNEKDIKWWYRQNMFLVVANNAKHKFVANEKNSNINNIIHPEHYTLKSKLNNEFRLGKSKPKKYFKLFIKSILYKFNLIK